MSEVFDCSDGAQLLQGTRLARQSLGRGELIVLPTDTVYGVAADAFSPEAVQRLLDAKGRGRQSPPPVLIPNTGTLAALAADATEALHTLADAFWPGPLTIITQANPALSWDLGETGGTVALRIPGNDFARELLQETGPLAVSSANSTGDPAAGSAAEAQQMLGDSVAVYLDGGEARGEASTIIDATTLEADGTGTVRVLRSGAITAQQLQEALPGATVVTATAPSAGTPSTEPDPAPDSEAAKASE
ncbi:L-threonylcarbamoyladenylate synthase [Leucobacter sp. G161]|uniref:L-threonylcarbamoyladenylate synthase n=1 Tax=Leucobacter sp. G161 TaxID=663704 RepID=UPI0009F8C156|nr:L-threonylcarbamoyladenylate synthase [Leucobacter sp. G161]